MDDSQSVPSQGQRFWQTQSKAFLRAADDPLSFYSHRARLIATLISRYCSPCFSLDVGCGPGLISYELAVRGFDVYGTDVAENMLDLAIKRTSDLLPDAEARFRLTQGTTPPFPWKFDLIAALGVFPYVSDYDAYLEYLAEQLKPGGFLVASCLRRFSLCTVKLVGQHMLKFQWNEEWGQVFVNLFRTGLWSGGFVEYDSSRQSYSGAAFRKRFQDHGFQLLETIDLYNLGNNFLDRRALSRSPVGKRLARKLAWCHVALFRRDV